MNDLQIKYIQFFRETAQLVFYGCLAYLFLIVAWDAKEGDGLHHLVTIYTCEEHMDSR